MSYTTKIKNEIVEIALEKSEALAELSAYIRNNGSISNNELVLTTENINIKNKLIDLFEEIYETTPNIEVKDGLNFNKKNLYVISISNNLNFILKDLCYYDENSKFMDSPKEYLVGANEEIRAYLRGVFLATGSINDPKTSRYHMEILITKPTEAVFVQKLLNIFDLNAKILTRDKGYMIYIKEAEKISDFLKIVGASKAVLYFEDVRIYHEAKNHTNRLNNCEQANVEKMIQSAQNEVKIIEKLKEKDMFDLLDEKDKLIATYRLKYPESSLQELSEIISIETSTKLTKSGIYHRLRKIKELGQKISNQ